MIIKNKHRNYVYYILFANLGIYLLQKMNPNFFKNLVLNSLTVQSQPWTIITSMFMHGSSSHLLFNMYALLLFGTLIEQKIGSKRFLLLYFSSGIIGALTFIIIRPGASAIGASGAIMGLLGMTIMVLPKMRVLFFFLVPMSMRTAGIIFAFIDIIGLFNPNNGIANSAHLGGLIVGLLYGWYLINKKNTFAKEFVSYASHHSTYNKTKNIEMNDEDINNYIKYGKL